jgi:hypothetical protein
MGALAEAKQEWKSFKHDEPGARFRNHRERMKEKPRGHSIVAIMIGVLLILIGVVLLFMPGPGTLLIAFGVALLASHSKRASALMDRSEPKLRRIAQRGKHKWDAMSAPAKVGLISALVILAIVAGLGMWKFVVTAYLLG